MLASDTAAEVEINFGTAIKLRREHLGMTQQELAEAVGINQSTVAKWEQRATTIFNAEQLSALAQALHTTQREIRAGLVPRSYVNPDTEESMMLGPMRDLRRLRQIDGLRYETAATMLSALRRDAERIYNKQNYVDAHRGAQGVMLDGVSEYDGVDNENGDD